MATAKSSKSGKSNLDAHAKQLEKQIHVIRKVQSLLLQAKATIADYPELASVFAEELNGLISGKTPVAPKRPAPTKAATKPAAKPKASPKKAAPGGTPIHLRIAKLLLDGNNDPKTVLEISAGTGATQSAVRQVIYRRHKQKFNRATENAEGLTTWKLSKEGLEEFGHVGS